MVDQIPKTVMWARCSDSQTTSVQEVVYQKCDSWNIVMVLEFRDGLDKCLKLRIPNSIRRVMMGGHGNVRNP